MELGKSFDSRKRMMVPGTLAIMAGVVCFVVAGFFLNRTRDFLARAVSVEGEIVDMEEKDDPDDGAGYSPVYSFVDESGKKQVIRSSFSSNPPRYEIGETVSVLYEPGDPQGARLNSFLDLYLVPLLAGIAGVVNILMGLFLIFLLPVFMR